jgi:hypothetical protein
MKQRLSEKRQRRCEEIAGKRYRSCWANGTSLKHGIAECWWGERDADRVDMWGRQWWPYIRHGQVVRHDGEYCEPEH